MHRHYGLRKTKPPATDGGPLPSDAWSGRAIVAGASVSTSRQSRALAGTRVNTLECNS